MFSWQLSLTNIVITVGETFYQLPAALTEMHADAIGITGLLNWYQRAYDVSKKQEEELAKLKAANGRR